MKVKGRQLQVGLMLAALAFFGLLWGGETAVAEPEAPQNNTYQTLPFSQNWSDTNLITTNDDWSGVPGIVGYLGNYTTSSPTNVDPQTLLTDYSSTDVDVIANQSNPNTQTTGGVAEFDGIADPVVAFQGSGTADAPYILIHLDTTGYGNIRVQYNLRDVDGSADNAVQQVALHYRVGESGNFTNVPEAYVADATTGPSLATLVTPVDVYLPAEANNQSQLQLRIMTTNASGSDEWVGIDDIVVTGTILTYDTITINGNLDDWNADAHKLGSKDGADYYLTWDADYLYVAVAGGRTATGSDRYNVAIDIDPTDIGSENSGTTSPFGGVTFGADGKPDYLLQRNQNGETLKRVGTSGSWQEWTSANSIIGSNDAESPNGIVEFRFSWVDMGVTDRNVPVGVYIWQSNFNDWLWGSFPPTNLGWQGESLQPLTTRVYLPTTDAGRIPRTYAQQWGDQTQFDASGSFSLLNQFAQIEITSGGGAGCSFKVAVRGNAPADTDDSAVRRSYTIEPAGCAPTVNMTLRYVDGDFDAPDERNGYADSADLVLFRWDGSQWVNVGGTANDTNNTVSVTGTSTFSAWSFAAGSGPTAVTLQSFSAHTSTAWLPILAAVMLTLGLVGVAKRPRRTNQEK